MTVAKPDERLFPKVQELATALAKTATDSGVADYATILPQLMIVNKFSTARRNGVQSLLEAVRQFDLAHGANAFATSVLPSIVESGCGIHKALPDDIPVLASKAGEAHVSAIFTKRQCHAVLSAAFLCLFPRQSNDCVSADRSLPSINYDEMHDARYNGPDHSAVEVAKLLMTLDYFNEMTTRIAIGVSSLDDPADSLIIRRNSSGGVPDGGMASPLRPVVMHQLRESIDLQKEMIRVDFANAVIGGASLSFGCVQEEIMFSICPEMNVARLVCPFMDENEAIVLLRAEQFSEVKEGTYAFSLQHGAPHKHENPRASVVTCIDAMDYRSLPRSMQYKPNVIQRELVKCCAGFDVLPFEGMDTVPTDLATGNWGCGAFMGDAKLKILIQWVAASAFGKTMHYFPFDIADLLQFQKIADDLVAKGVTVAPLYTFLMSQTLGPRTIFDDVRKEFGIFSEAE